MVQRVWPASPPPHPPPLAGAPPPTHTQDFECVRCQGLGATIVIAAVAFLANTLSIAAAVLLTFLNDYERQREQEGTVAVPDILKVGLFLRLVCTMRTLWWIMVDWWVRRRVGMPRASGSLR